MIFNVFAGLQVALVAIPAALTYAVLHYGLGLDSAPWWAALVAVGCLVPVDLLARLASMAEPTESEDDDEPPGPAPGPMALFYPASGGHVMFVPMYAVGGVLTVALLLGWVNP